MESNKKNIHLTLVGSHTSPFVRKLRIFLLNERIPFEFKAINYLQQDDSDYLKSLSPIQKIPILLVTENEGVKSQKKIYDSRLIYQFLVQECLPEKHPAKAMKQFDCHWENSLTLVDTLLETSINLFSLKRGGMNLMDEKNTYVQKQIHRIDVILAELASLIKDQHLQSQWNYFTMSLYSALKWGLFREMITIEGTEHYETFHNFLHRYDQHPTVLETLIIH